MMLLLFKGGVGLAGACSMACLAQPPRSFLAHARRLLSVFTVQPPSGAGKLARGPVIGLYC